MENETKTFKVYRNGELDKIATYGPVVKAKLIQIASKIDHQFTKPL